MRAVLLVALWFLTSVSVLGQPEAEQLQAKLDTSVSRYTLSANGLADALMRTAKEFHLPMGIEWVKDKETLRSLSHTWKGETLRAILHSIVKEYPAYTLQVEHGLVHLFRRDLLNDGQNFLNLKVPDFFEVRDEIGGITNQRLKSVVQNMVSPRYLPPGAGEGGDCATGIDEKPLLLTLRGLTIREALDKLAEASGHKMWIVTFSDGPGLTPTGFRRTETIWHPTPFPDSGQPMWDFLAWQQYLPEYLPQSLNSSTKQGQAATIDNSGSIF